jgi:hypothetical protein
MSGKTNGQLLYEHKSPPVLRVVPAGIHFPTADDVMHLPNPNHIPWQFLTAACKAGWEKTAIGHNLFSPRVN